MISEHQHGRSARTSLRSFAAADRFATEINSVDPSARKAGYVLLGDETFLQDRCRRAALEALTPRDNRDFCVHDLDLADISVYDVLDQAQTPSLMAPFQLFFVRNLKLLYTRGSKKEEFAALDGYFRSPNPQAVLLFIGDHLRIPADLRRMDMQDKDRYERIRETLGDGCSLVELARVDEADAERWLLQTALAEGVQFDQDAARELVDSLGADMMLIASELEKLLLYVTARRRRALEQTGTTAEPASASDQEPAPSVRITIGDVETVVLAAKQRSLYELTDAISSKDQPRALALLHGLLNASDAGDEAAIGHLYMLARTFRQMLIITEKNVRDSRAIWQALWQGFRMPPFAADDIIRQARRYRSRRDLTRCLRLIARADLELRSSPVSKRLVLERLILELASSSKESSPPDAALQFAIHL